jgi:hypothetical protein
MAYSGLPLLISSLKNVVAGIDTGIEVEEHPDYVKRSVRPGAAKRTASSGQFMYFGVSRGIA